MNNDPKDTQRIADTIPQINVDIPGDVTVERPATPAQETAPAYEKAVEIDIPPANRPKKVYGGMWGTSEMGEVAVGLLAVAGVLALFIFFVVPAKRQVERDKANQDRLQADLATARERYGNVTSTEIRVAKLVESADSFEANFLPVAGNGRAALYQKINGLIAGYGLVNTSGPDFAPLGTADLASSSSDEERGRARFQSLFPGDYVTVTLEGPYANLRRFIHDIETGRDFIVIASVELEPSDSQSSATKPQTTEQGAFSDEETDPTLQNPGQLPPPRGRVVNRVPQYRQQQAQPSRPTGRTLGSIVSLRLEMAAYYRRPNADAPEVTQ